MRVPPRWLLLSALCGAALLLGACGQKGDLYLPDRQASGAAAGPAHSPA